MQELIDARVTATSEAGRQAGDVYKVLRVDYAKACKQLISAEKHGDVS